MSNLSFLESRHQSLLPSRGMPGSVPFLCLPATSADAPRRLVIMSDPTHCQRACASVPSTDTRSRTPLRQCSLLNYPHPRA